MDDVKEPGVIIAIGGRVGKRCWMGGWSSSWTEGRHCERSEAIQSGTRWWWWPDPLDCFAALAM